MIERNELQVIVERMNEPKKFIQVLVGPRQVGKTTLILQALDKITLPSKYETADAISTNNAVWISQIWESVRMQMKLNNLSEYILVIDEVQKIENWSETVKKEWDYDNRLHIDIKLILLGSSRLLLQKGLTESLAGRFETTNICHWSFAEMEAAFGWDIRQFVYFGGYPGAAEIAKDEKRWKNYIRSSLIETSISKDILMLTRVDKPALLRQLFELGAMYSGQILSFNKMLGQLLDAGNTTTLSHYLTLLSDSGLLGGIEKYSGSMAQVRSSSPKLQVFNNALLTALSDMAFENVLVNPTQWGRLMESAVGVHLINHRIKGNYELYYWREGIFEVDFVLRKGTKIIGLEVKSGAKAENKGMSVFVKKYKHAKVMVIGTYGFPYEEFLKIDPTELF
jgi:predicted AAA+ superfamily ATPase